MPIHIAPGGAQSCVGVEMRTVVRLAKRSLHTLCVCFGLIVLLAGCYLHNEEKLISEGIGTELPAEDIFETSRRQDIYLSFLCHRAGMSRPTDDGNPFGFCDMGAYGNAAWTQLVRAGFNDIDRRCDSYLAWLNARRRNRNAILSQITDTRNFTEAVMFTAGASATALTVAGLAFGLASNTFTNYYSRLLLEIERSTVEVLVIEKRAQYRDTLKNVLIGSQPDAIHVLREYLLICTPHYIENRINQRTRDSVAGNPSADDARPEQVRRSVVAGAVPAQRADRSIVITPGPKQKAVGTAGKIEPPVISLDRAKGIQRTICVSDTGDLSSSGTRTALAALKAALYFPRTSAAIRSGVIEDVDQLAEISKAVGAVPSCTKADLAGGFEVGLVARFGAPVVREHIQIALDKAKLTVPQELINPSNTTVGGSIRAAVTALRKHYVGLKLVPPETIPPPKVTSIDAAMWGQILRDNVIQ